ncbi:MAG: hypothetical protein MHPSP_001895, partial [Paramarteilia canceri]
MAAKQKQRNSSTTAAAVESENDETISFRDSTAANSTALEESNGPLNVSKLE